MLVWTVVFGVLEFSYRPAVKNHNLSFMIGPPNVPSCVLLRMSLCVMPAVVSRGVSLIHFGLLKFSRKLPLNLLPPLLVTMLMTPPEKRPHSAEIPDVMMLNS